MVCFAPHAVYTRTCHLLRMDRFQVQGCSYTKNTLIDFRRGKQNSTQDYGLGNNIGAIQNIHGIFWE